MNFDTLLAEIQTDINDTSDRTKTRIANWINDGIASICSRRRWSFLRIQVSDEHSLTETTTPLLYSALQTNGGTVPAKFITNVYDVTDGSKRMIPRISYEGLGMSGYGSGSSGVPLGWYQLNTDSGSKQIQFSPKLTTSVRKFIFSYIRQLTRHASSSTDTIAIPDEYIQVLKAYVEWRVNKFNSDDRANECFQEYQIMLNDMIRDCSIYSEMSNGTGRIIDRFSNGVTGV